MFDEGKQLSSPKNL